MYYITGEDDPEITEIAEDGSFGLTQWARTAQQKGAVLLDITRTNAANRVTPVVTTPKNGGNQPSVERSDAFDKK